MILSHLSALELSKKKEKKVIALSIYLKKMVSESRVLKLHRWIVMSVMGSLIIWPYLKYLYWIGCLSIILWNSFMLYEYQAIITYVYSDEIATTQPG